jgi:hypothetical protein
LLLKLKFATGATLPPPPPSLSPGGTTPPKYDDTCGQISENFRATVEAAAEVMQRDRAVGCTCDHRRARAAALGIAVIARIRIGRVAGGIGIVDAAMAAAVLVADHAEFLLPSARMPGDEDFLVQARLTHIETEIAEARDRGEVLHA